jgi:hypothetical protein
MAAPALWLLSDEAAHVTGQFIEADAWDANIRGLQAARRAARPLASSDSAGGCRLLRPGPIAHLPAGADLALSRALDSALPGARLTGLRDQHARRLKRA